MSDVHTRKVRSYNMSLIRGKDTKPELLVRKFLHRNGFRFRLNVKTMPGKPDIVLPKHRCVIFINGCFWHGHEFCRYSILPKTRTEWWHQKILETKCRDEKNKVALNIAGWKIIIIWTCMLKPQKRNKTLNWLIKDIPVS